MFDLDKWIEIWHTLTANKIRSLMTGFGVFWGIFMLFILLGLGNSFEGGLLKEVGGLATNSCFFFTNPTSEAYKGLRKGRQWNMNNRDLVLIKEKANSLQYISPMLFGVSSANNIVYGRKTTPGEIMGVYPENFKIQTQTVLSGRLFNEIDIDEDRKVTVIGKTIAENLFGNTEDAIGKNIKVNGLYFNVIGVVRPNSKAQVGGDAESKVFIPFTTMQKAFNYGDKIHFLGATTKPGFPVSVLEDEIKTILKSNHTISPTDEKAARSFNIEKEFETFDNLFLGIRFLMWIVGIGTLFSGIVGVTNIMLVVVKERTREIGVRRALGAKPITILTQIMSESFVLTFIAGFLGLFAGVVVLEIISMFMKDMTGDMFLIPPFVSFKVAIIALIIVMFSGLIAGLIPSARALSIKAIDAIRDE